MASINLFISCVSSEFASYRGALRKYFTRPNIEVKIQEDFYDNGGPTLEKLDDYIKNCDAVIHIAGDMTGSMANAPSVQYIKDSYPDFGTRIRSLQPVLDGTEQLSYTQWEAWLAVYFKKRLFIVVPNAGVNRDSKYVFDATQAAHQQAHLDKLAAEGYYVGTRFDSEADLAAKLQHSKLGDVINSASPTHPSNLPYHTIGTHFKGREADMVALKDMFANITGRCKGIALYGLGGMGKTRLAVEYALKHAEDYSALLFVTAAEAGLLKTNIAALAASTILDLPEQAASDEAVRFAAVMHWLNANKGWLLIMDNADTEEASKAAEQLFAQLQQGHVLITARFDTWSPQLKKKQLELISKAAAIDFILETTAEEREKRDDDKEMAAGIADDLGCLALALEQARAYIATKEISLATYRKRWEASRAEVLTWYDEQQMQYPRSVAITWQTSFDQLSPAATTLLNRLAWLAPDPIPKKLLEVAIPDTEPIDAVAAREELKKYSLATSAADKRSFTVHRLVQNITRNRMEPVLVEQTLTESLRWINEAFIGEPNDVRSWPVLEPLVPHVIILLESVKDKEAEKDFTRLMNQVALLFGTKAQYARAERICQRALEIDEQNLGSEHSLIAIRLNNLAQFLQATNRFDEAELMMRRALKIDQKILGSDHPSVARDLNNLARLLKDTNRLEEAEPLYKIALAIDEKKLGPDHPNVAIDLNNLARLLHDTNRLAEAEPLMRRALEIDEKNYGSNHPSVAIRLNNLAQLLKDTNRLVEAKPLMSRVVEIFEKHYGSDHPNVAVSLNNLAQLLKMTNRIEEVEPLMHRVLEIDEKSYGPYHTSVARDLNNLALLLQDSNRLAEAEPLIKRSLVIFLKSYGPEHPHTKIVQDNYISLLQTMGKTEEEIKTILQEIMSGQGSSK
ncbi:MAG: tetratricopeptide repeat protein [Chitinophagaceae bacterium]|nr:tetratricopeptide repeat protein [Chitinophagaceae bacterium]